MTRYLVTRDRRRGLSTRFRTALVGVAALLNVTLAGCGDPDDGGGGDGGGYLTQTVDRQELG